MKPPDRRGDPFIKFVMELASVRAKRSDFPARNAAREWTPNHVSKGPPLSPCPTPSSSSPWPAALRRGLCDWSPRWYSFSPVLYTFYLTYSSCVFSFFLYSLRDRAERRTFGPFSIQSLLSQREICSARKFRAARFNKSTEIFRWKVLGAILGGSQRLTPSLTLWSLS